MTTRYISPENQTALEKRALVLRDFVWLTVRNRTTNALVNDGMWSDVGDITIPVVDALTGIQTNRTFAGTGTLVEISPIPLVANLSVQSVTIKMMHVGDRVQDLIRTYDPQQGRISIYRALFDPATRNIVSGAFSRFTGFIDQVTIVTPVEGDIGYAEFECKSHTQEITRSNPDTRSSESQKIRLSTDKFYDDSSVSGGWEIFWGSVQGVVKTQKRKKFLGIF